MTAAGTMKRTPLVVLAIALSLAACSFESPLEGKPSADTGRPKLEALPPPTDIQDDPPPAPSAAAPPAMQLPLNPSPPAALAPGLAEPPPGQTALPPPGAPLAEPAGPSLDWHTSLEGEAVVIELADATSHYRVERVELLGPGGARIPSAALSRTVERSFGYEAGDRPLGPVGVGGSGGSAGHTHLSVGIGANDFVGKNYNATRMTRTRTRIALADPAAYRRDPSAWKIAVELIDSQGNPSFVEIPAPAK